MQCLLKLYLHCTVTLTASDALSHSLLASHLYSPASLLLMLVNSSKLLLVRWPLATLIQNTVGWGVTDALQNTLALWLSIINWSSIDWMDAGTAIKLHYAFTVSCTEIKGLSRIRPKIQGLLKIAQTLWTASTTAAFTVLQIQTNWHCTRPSRVWVLMKKLE